MDNRDLTSLLRALADPARLRILQYLSREAETTVTALTRALRISQPLASWHLRTLRRVGLVTTRRVGREVHCTLNPARIDDAGRSLAELVACPANSPQA